MALPGELSRDKTDRLRPPQPDQVPEEEVAPEPAPVAVAPAPVVGPRRRAVRLAKQAARQLLGERGVDKLRGYLRVDEALRVGSESLRRTAELEQQVASMQRYALGAELVQAEAHAASINLELLKGEVRSVIQTLEDLGMAIAPAAGLAGAGERLSELRERVNGLDRRLRTLQAQATTPAPAAPAPAPPAAAGSVPAAPSSALFDYVGFERRFRGDPEAVAAALAERYLDLLVANPPVVDIGCGRAELVEMLAKRGVEAIGVDTDPSMVAEARDRGLDVRQVDGNSFLRSREPGSLGAIIATHLVEHLEFADLVELLELAATRLRPGGVLIAETPNPTSLVVLGNSFILDPTHLRPLHPSLLTFLCEGAGFRDVRLRFHAPASDYHLPMIDEPDAPPWTKRINEAFAKLNQVLFGPQEYALIATAAPPTHGATEEEHS
ncbi:MAG TPA: class I SAM-dependent methyltransferase [Actinomycetota bacterium]|nr:class I SAM-dependent methyltransferase [Actinomycetota bacterium]